MQTILSNVKSLAICFPKKESNLSPQGDKTYDLVEGIPSYASIWLFSGCYLWYLKQYR